MQDWGDLRALPLSSVVLSLTLPVLLEHSQLENRESASLGTPCSPWSGCWRGGTGCRLCVILNYFRGMCPLLMEVFLSPCWGQEDAALYRHLGALLRHCLMISADGEDRTEEFHRSVLGTASPAASPAPTGTPWALGRDTAHQQLLGLAWASLTLLELRNSLSCPGNAMWECHGLLAPEILFCVLSQRWHPPQWATGHRRCVLL